MVLLFDIATGLALTFAGFTPSPDYPITKDMVDSIEFVEGVPEGQALYRIYDEARMTELFAHIDTGGSLRILTDPDGSPIDIELIPPADPAPTE